MTKDEIKILLLAIILGAVALFTSPRAGALEQDKQQHIAVSALFGFAVANVLEDSGHPVFYLLVCRDAKETYFIKPSGILLIMQGLNGAPNCMSAIDTKGKSHVLCQTKDTPDICELVEPGPTI